MWKLGGRVIVISKLVNSVIRVISKVIASPAMQRALWMRQVL